MKKRRNGEWLKRLYRVISHNEKLQNLIIVICCFGLIGIIALWCWLCG